MSWTPFFLKRIGKGRDSSRHLFCIGAKGNPELIRTGETDAEVLINGASSSDSGKMARAGCQGAIDALNQVWQDYLDGKFHEDFPPEGTAVLHSEMSTDEQLEATVTAVEQVIRQLCYERTDEIDEIARTIARRI